MPDHKFQFQPAGPDDKGRAHLTVGDAFSVTVNCTGEGLIVDLYNARGTNCLDTAAVPADAFTNFQESGWNANEFRFDKEAADATGWAHIAVADMASVTVSAGAKGISIGVHDSKSGECLACLSADAPSARATKVRNPAGPGLGR